MRLIFVFFAILGLTACANISHSAEPAAAHRLTSTPAPSPTPVASPSMTSSPTPSPTPTKATPLIANTEPDKAICTGFMMIGHKVSADKFMAFITFGGGQATANHASNKLINAIVTWYDDSNYSWGNYANVGADLAAVRADCASIGVTG